MARNRPREPKEAGFVLIDVLIASAIVSLVAVVVLRQIGSIAERITDVIAEERLLQVARSTIVSLRYGARNVAGAESGTTIEATTSATPDGSVLTVTVRAEFRGHKREARLSTLLPDHRYAK